MNQRTTDLRQRAASVIARMQPNWRLPAPWGGNDEPLPTPFTDAVLAIVSAHGGYWRGTSRELLELAETYREQVGEPADDTWPFTPHAVTITLRREERTLNARGILLTRSKSNGQMLLRLEWHETARAYRTQDVFPAAIRAIVDRAGGSWEGQTSQLLAALEPYRPASTRANWPTGWGTLNHRLEDTATLAAAGVEAHPLRKSNGRRLRKLTLI